jgi:hypothetical protein
VQTIYEVNLQVYFAADNPFDVVSQPEECGRCKARGSFHRHGTYRRYIQEEQRKVARFLCKVCHLTVSVLPAFVLPYRPRLVEEVQRYFEAPDEQRREQSYADTLRHYWRQWCTHWPVLQQAGWPVVRPLGREPRSYWRQVRAVAGGVARAQVELVSRYGLALLRRYACHRAPPGA